MKKIVITIVILLAIGGLWWAAESSRDPEVIKIGVIASLTGKGATRGESTQQGLELALAEIEQSGVLDDQEIELVYQDVPLDGAKRAPAALNLLTDIEKVDAIIGPMGSNVAMSVASLIDAKEVPVILHTVSIQGVTDDNEYVLRLWPVGRDYADAIRERVQELGYERVAVLSATTDNTKDVLGFLKEEVEFVADEQVTVDHTDFRTQLSKIVESEPDALFLNLFTGQNGIAAKQARELGITVPIFTNSVTSQIDLDVGGAEALEGAWFPEFAGYGDEARRKFIEMFGAEPGAPDNAAAAHDALLVLTEAVAAVGTDGEAIKNYLYTNTFEGSMGEFYFHKSGDAAVPLTISVIRDGEIVDLEQE